MTRKARIATAAAVLALAATPTALAGAGPRADAHDRSATEQANDGPPDAFERALNVRLASDAYVADAHKRTQPGTPVETAPPPDAFERAVLRSQSGGVASYPEHLSDLSPAQPTAVSSGGFDWGDATIGVLGGVGLSLLLGGGLILLVSHGRTRQRVAVR